MSPLVRPLGKTAIQISPVAMGCWPIAGVTTLGVTEAESLATIAACFDLGVNFLDTAFCYGLEGESERLIARAIRGRREQTVIATKGGIHWQSPGKQAHDGSPATLRRQCDESLRRLETDHVELYYLHAPDPKVPLAESAGAIRDLIAAGKARTAGVSNVNVAQLEEFAAACPLAAYQPPYNMLQRDIEAATLPWCRERGVSVLVYWPLMKGLLAGKLSRDHVFPPSDGRAKYPMFHGEEWQKNQDFVDELRIIATDVDRTVAQVVINWTIYRPGVTAALCGARRPDQIRDNAGGMLLPDGTAWRLSETQLARIDAALAARGQPVSGRAV
jgi:aryl-alcohol dehydrogenase-like predicted oxidoreductase